MEPWVWPYACRGRGQSRPGRGQRQGGDQISQPGSFPEFPPTVTWVAPPALAPISIVGQTDCLAPLNGGRSWEAAPRSLELPGLEGRQGKGSRMQSLGLHLTLLSQLPPQGLPFFSGRQLQGLRTELPAQPSPDQQSGAGGAGQAPAPPGGPLPCLSALRPGAGSKNRPRPGTVPTQEGVWEA